MLPSGQGEVIYFKFVSLFTYIQHKHLSQTS